MRMLTEVEYKKLKNTIYVLRMSGAHLTPEQKEDVKKIQRAVTLHEEYIEALKVLCNLVDVETD